MNNHPIKIGDIVGVHNGTLTNHEKIFDNLKCGRDGKVDSEAIFRLLHHYTNNGEEPFSTEILQETCKRLTGTYSVLAFSGNNPFQVVAFRDGRPLEACIIRPLKMVLIASEKDFLKAAIFRYNKMANLYQTGTSKFVPLKKNDVELQTLTDDSLYLFDVRHDITDETKIPDLFITEKVPRIDKIWGIEKKTITSINNAWNNNNLNHSTEKKMEVKAKPGANTGAGKTNIIKTNTSLKKTKTDDRVGMAWNRHSYEYMAVVGAEKHHRNVEIDCEDNKLKELLVSTNEKKVATGSNTLTSHQDFDFKESTKPVDDLLTDLAKISICPLNPVTTETEDKQPSVYPMYKHKEDAKTLLDKKKIIDVETHPDVLEKAVIVTKEAASFSSNYDLANALGISSTAIMGHMDLYSLANRIKATFFKEWWYRGYVARLKEENSPIDQNEWSRKLLVKYRNKTTKGESSIRVLKSMVKILDSIITKFPKIFSEDYKVDMVVADTLESGAELKTDILKRVFREGDLKEQSIVRRVMSSVANKEGR